MKLFLKYMMVFALLAVLTEVGAQKTFQPKATQFDWKGIVYRKEVAWEGRLHTNGALIGINIGKIKTYYKTNYYHLSLGYLKDPREKRQNRNISINFPDRSKSFVFGKQNSIINIRGAVGVKKFITEKARRKGIAIGYDYSFGPSLALLKPYYLELIFPTDNGANNDREVRDERYVDEGTSQKFLTFNEIYGGAGYFKGFSEISVVPGIHGKLGLFFSIGAFDKYVKAFEIGLMGDIYIKKIPILVETEAVSNKPFFFNFYAKFILGKRSN